MTAGTTITGFASSASATLARSWPALALRGGAAVLFGLVTVINPGATLATLVLLFGVFALVDGALNIVAGLRRREAGGSAAGGGRAWGGLLLTGALAITVGALTLWYPRMTAVFLVYLVAAWAIATGVGQILAAVRLRREIAGEWLLGLSGLLSVLFGVFLLAAPGAGALALALWIGAYALFAGVLLLVLAFRLRGWARGGARTLAESR